MCKMCHGIVGVETEEEFYKTISYHHVFCLDWVRDEKEIERLVGENKSISEQQTIHRTRSPDGHKTLFHHVDGLNKAFVVARDRFIHNLSRMVVGKAVEFGDAAYVIMHIGALPHNFLHQCGSYAAHEIKHEISFRSPHPLKDGSEHP